MALLVLLVYTLAGWRSLLLCLALAVGLGAVTARRNDDYHTALAIWGDTLSKCAGSVRVQLNYGLALAQTGKLAEAIGYYREAIRMQPRYTPSHFILANALVRTGRAEEAIAEYQETLRLQPDHPVAHNNLGNTLVRLGRMSEAIAEYRETLRLKPDYVLARNNLGNVLFLTGRIPEAIQAYEETLRTDPDFAEARQNLARLKALPAATAPNP
jgi:tetratricopeptide (TPR) repeat protein